jgi:uncharacterized cupin superfamily protein
MAKLVPVFQHEANPLHPVLGNGPGPYDYALLGDPGGLTQFGVHFESLPPGSKSGHRHWHEAEDEALYVDSGHPVLVEDVETLLKPGAFVAWPAGRALGHCLENRSDRAVTYLVMGSRYVQDVIHYTDHDLVTHKNGKARRYLRRDGTPVDGGARDIPPEGI